MRCTVDLALLFLHQGKLVDSALYVVATPIGNLKDLSPRAQQTLAEVDLVACEDTRQSRRLLDAHGLTTPMQSLHEHNEEARVTALIERLREGESIALISDAGTPLISDPGYRLVSAAHDAGVPVHAVPGPCAAIAALSIAGLPTDRFMFEGFLPAKTAARRAALRALENATSTLVFYETGRRVDAALVDIVDLFGPERRVAVARELTKRFEQCVVDEAAAMLAWLRADAQRMRGEFVLVVAGAEERTAGLDEVDHVVAALLPDLPAAAVARAAARITGVNKATCYARVVELKERGGD